MSCRYLENTITIEGIVTRIKTYNPPFRTTVFNGNHEVVWFKDVLVRVDGDPITKKGKPKTRNLYIFVEPSTDIKTELISEPRKGDKVRITYAPIAVNNIMRGCAISIEVVQV